MFCTTSGAKYFPDEVLAAHHYVQRILADFYDDRRSVESLLIAGRHLPSPS
jgi:hypothetical protein